MSIGTAFELHSPISRRVRHQLPHYRILMDIQPMPCKILRVANPMIGESLLPNFAAADFHAHRMRVASLDQLHRPLQCDVIRRRKKKVHMVRHQNESMQLETAPSTISIESLQEQSGVRLHDEESSPLKCREIYEVSSRRRDQSCRFHRRWPSAAQSRDLLPA